MPKALSGVRVAAVLLFAMCDEVLAAWQFLPDPLRSLVVIMDVGRKRVVGTLPTELPSRNVVVDRIHRRLYVANTGWMRTTMEPSSITVWQLPDESMLGDHSPSGAFLAAIEPIERIAVGAGPFDLSLDASGNTLVVANTADGSISVVDVWSKTVQSIQIGGRPSSVVQRPHSTLLYVARYESSDVVVLDTSTETILSTIPLEGRPTDVVMLDDGSRVLAVLPELGAVSEIDTSSNQVSRQTAVGNNASTIRTKGGHLYVSDVISGSVTLLDSISGTARRSLEMGSAIASMVVDEETGGVATISFKTGTVTIANRSLSETVASFPHAYLVGER